MLGHGDCMASALYSLILTRLAIEVRLASCTKYSDMLGGRLFSHSALPTSGAFEVEASVFAASAWFGLGILLEQSATRSWTIELFRDGLLMSWATSSFWKSLSSNGTGRGVVHVPSIIQVGRPVITLSKCSIVYNDHQTRYRISLDVSDV